MANITGVAQIPIQTSCPLGPPEPCMANFGCTYSYQTCGIAYLNFYAQLTPAGSSEALATAAVLTSAGPVSDRFYGMFTSFYFQDQQQQQYVVSHVQLGKSSQIP